jgi:hypothetical protein
MRKRLDSSQQTSPILRHIAEEDVVLRVTGHSVVPFLSSPHPYVEPQRSGLGRRETRWSHAITTPGSTLTGVVPANSCMTGSPYRLSTKR